MKKVAILLMMTVLILTGCMPGAQPTLSDAEMATRVASILTAMPTNTLSAGEMEPTAAAVEATATPEEGITTTPKVKPVTPTVGKPTKTAKPTKAPTKTSEPVEPSITPTITETPEPSATPPEGDPRTKLGDPKDTDKMDGPDHWTWPTGTDPAGYTSVEYKNGWMHLTGLKDTSGWRIAAVRDLTNFYLEAKVRTETCSGSDNYGIIFRVPVLRDADRGYLYGVTCDGKYYLKMWDGKSGTKGKMTTLIWAKADEHINAGSNKTNRLGIMAVDGRLILYANGYKLAEAKDTTYKAGYFGLFVNPDNTEDLTIRVDEMSFWLNPKP